VDSGFLQLLAESKRSAQFVEQTGTACVLFIDLFSTSFLLRALMLPGISLKQTGRLLVKIWCAMLLYLLLRTATSTLAGSVDERSLVENIQTWALYFGLPWIVLLPLAQRFLLRFPLVSTRTFRNVRIYLSLLLLLLTVHALTIEIISWCGKQLSFASAIELNNSRLLNQLMMQEGFALFDALIFTLLAARNRLDVLHEKLMAKELDAFKLSRSLTDSRLQTLKMQLNPHFLFNSLNGVSVLIDKNENARARDMLGELSSFLRQTLRNPKEKWVSLAKELEFVKMYLNIEQYRFGKRLTYFEECEPLALAAKIPPMLLQPLFENAIVHGLADKQGPCRLSFECRLYDRYLIMLIFDNGENFSEISDPLHKGGIGLSNIQDRLREVYGDNYSVSIEKKADGTLVTLKLPSYKDSHF
jgi:sensor histidine kinase YesM